MGYVVEKVYFPYNKRMSNSDGMGLSLDDLIEKRRQESIKRESARNRNSKFRSFRIRLTVRGVYL